VKRGIYDFRNIRCRALDGGAGFDFTDITYHRANGQGTVRIAFNRPEVRNAFRPQTVDELYLALDHARMTTDVGVVLLTGNGPSPRTADGPFAPGVISGSAARTATGTSAVEGSIRAASAACISWKYSA